MINLVCLRKSRRYGALNPRGNVSISSQRLDSVTSPMCPGRLHNARLARGGMQSTEVMQETLFQWTNPLIDFQRISHPEGKTAAEQVHGTEWRCRYVNTNFMLKSTCAQGIIVEMREQNVLAACENLEMHIDGRNSLQVNIQTLRYIGISLIEIELLPIGNTYSSSYPTGFAET